MQFSDNGVRFDVTLRGRGRITFADDLSDVESLSDGGSFKMRDWGHIVPRTVEITSSGGTLTRTYYVGGIKKLWDDDARRFLATQLPVLVRRSGLAAEARVKAIFERKGINGVLEEIDLLGGDYARRVYLVALLDTASFDSNGVEPVLARVAEQMKSDYDRRQVLERVASRVRLDGRGASAYVQAMASMRSDYDQRQALSALARSGGSAVEGDAMVAAVAHIKSSYDKRMVLADLLSRRSLGTAAKEGVLAAAATMQGDYDRAEVLTDYVKAFGVESAMRQPFFAAVKTMHSDYDRRRVLTEVAASGAVSPDVQQAALDVVSMMSSDHDRAEVLLAFVGAQGIDSSIRPAFVSATERIRSSHDQNRVLAALVRAERR